MYPLRPLCRGLPVPRHRSHRGADPGLPRALPRLRELHPGLSGKSDQRAAGRSGGDRERPGPGRPELCPRADERGRADGGAHHPAAPRVGPGGVGDGDHRRAARHLLPGGGDGAGRGFCAAGHRADPLWPARSQADGGGAARAADPGRGDRQPGRGGRRSRGPLLRPGRTAGADADSPGPGDRRGDRAGPAAGGDPARLPAALSGAVRADRGAGPRGRGRGGTEP